MPQFPPHMPQDRPSPAVSKNSALTSHALCASCRGAVSSCPGGLRADCPVAPQGLTGLAPLVAPPAGELLRVVQVVNVRWFNATAWYGLFLSRLLKDAGHEVRVLALPGTDSFTKAEEWDLDPTPLPLNSANPLTVASLAASLARLVRGFRPHVVNCHRGESFILWGLLKAAGYPFALVRTRGDQRAPKGNLPNRFTHSRLADAVIATNSRTADDLRRILLVPEAQIHTIPGGVDTRRFFPDPEGRARVRAEWGLRDEETAVGILGRFDAVKGQKELIEAVATLRWEGRRDLRLILAGFPTSTSLDKVQTWLADAGMADAAIITGKHPDVRACINALDLGVVASVGSEAIARAALEIMACAVPLISTDVGVMPDLLEPAALVPPADSAALAEGIRRFLDDAAWGPELIRSQHERMRSLTEHEFLAQTLAVYRTVLNKSST